MDDVEQLMVRYENRKGQIWIYVILIIIGVIASIVIFIVGGYKGYLIGIAVLTVSLVVNPILYIFLKSTAKDDLKEAVNQQGDFWKYEAVEEAIIHIETNTPIPLEKINAFANDQLIQNVKTRYPSLEIERISMLIPSDTVYVIQDLISKNPSLGTYHQVEQFFVKNISKLQIQIDSLKELACYYCDSPIGRNHKFCSNCQKEILICIVCKLPINFGSEIGSCCLCNSVAHYNHLQEWVKTQGKCPRCLQEITLDGIIPQLVNLKK